MRRRVSFVFVVSSTLGLAAACATYGAATESASPSADGGAIDGNDATPGDQSDGSTATDGGSPTRFCARVPDARLCDDFEDDAFPSPQWTSMELEGASASALTRVTAGADHLLAVAVPSNDASAAAALTLDLGAPAKVSVAFTAHVQTTATAAYYEIVNINAIVSGPNTVSVAYDNGKLLATAAGAPAIVLGPAPASRTRYVATLTGSTLEVRNVTGTVLGSVTTASPMTGQLRLAVGLAYALAAHGGTIEIDDVVVDY